MTVTIGQIREELRAEIKADGSLSELSGLWGTRFHALVELFNDHECVEGCRGSTQHYPDPSERPPFRWAGHPSQEGAQR